MCLELAKKKMKLFLRCNASAFVQLRGQVIVFYSKKMSRVLLLSDAVGKVNNHNQGDSTEKDSGEVGPRLRLHTNKVKHKQGLNKLLARLQYQSQCPGGNWMNRKLKQSEVKVESFRDWL